MKQTLFIVGLLLLMLQLSAQTSVLKFRQVSGDIYLYTTHKLFSGTLFPSNSVYIVTDSGVVLFDTPWDETQFQPLLDSISKRHNKPVTMCIATHYHDDRTAGLEYFNTRGIATYSTRLTHDLCVAHGQKKAKHTFANDTVFTVGEKRFEIFYPGEGHTKDNVAVWFNDEKVLYGGCLVKSTENNSLGNIADANLSVWPASIRKLKRKYKKIRIVVPGHFAISGGKKSLNHTLRLLRRRE